MPAHERSYGKLGLVVLVIVALCVVTLISGQSANAKNGKDLGHGKLEASLEALDGSNIDPNAVAGFIIQFLDDEAIAGATTSKQELKKAAKAARKRAILDAGGEPEQEFDNLPMHKARLTYGAMKNLARHPHVTRISIDHVVNGSTYTTARAIGANQVWAGSYGVPSFTGRGVGVAVLDSGIWDQEDMYGQVSGENMIVPIDGRFCGHGTLVGSMIAGTGAMSRPASGFPVQYKGIAYGSKVIDVRALGQDGSGLTSDVITGSSTILAGSGSTGVIRSTTSAKWYPAFVNPNSMGNTDADSILMFGVSPFSLQTGPQGAWFYPSIN